MWKKVRILIGVALLIVGGVCFFYPNFREWRTQRDVDRIIENFEKNFPIEETEGSEPSSSESDEEPDTEFVSEDGEIESEEKTTTTVTTLETEDGVRPFQDLYDEMLAYNQHLAEDGQHIVDAFSYAQTPIDLSQLPNGDATIGYIEIPDMKVRLPLFLGASDSNLSHGAAVMSETSMPIGGEDTNCVIAGHRGFRGSAFFQYIENMKEGSVVYITNPWETLVYRVVSIDIVDPNDVSSVYIQDGKDMVTLLSCHPYVLGGGPYRYLVYCERAGTQVRSISTEIENPEVTETPPESAETESEFVTEFETVQTGADGTVVNVQNPEEDSLIVLERMARIGVPIGLGVLIGLVLLIRYLRNRKSGKKSSDDEFC